jgi:hypothetical protein
MSRDIERGTISAIATGVAVINAIISAVTPWPWSMLAAIFGGLSLITLWYVNFLKPKLKRRALKAATKTYFLVPLRTQHECSYADQDDQEHILKELSLRPNQETVVDLVAHVQATLSYSEICIGFMGDPNQEPYFTKYFNRYITSGRGREVDPELEQDDDFIDKHYYYHRKVSKMVSAGTVLSLAFTIKTRDIGLYPLNIQFISDQEVGEEASLYVTVEKAATITLCCVDPNHKHLQCATGIAVPR